MFMLEIISRVHNFIDENIETISYVFHFRIQRPDLVS